MSCLFGMQAGGRRGSKSQNVTGVSSSAVTPQSANCERITHSVINHSGLRPMMLMTLCRVVDARKRTSVVSLPVERGTTRLIEDHQGAVLETSERHILDDYSGLHAGSREVTEATRHC